MKKLGIIIALIVVLGLAGLGYAMSRDNAENNSNTTNTNTANTDKTADQELENTNQNQQANMADTIEYTNSGFSSSTLTVKAGTTITIKNSSSRPLQFSSDDHPEHTNDPELNTRTLSPGGAQTLTVTVKGKHGIHNHLNDSHGATLIVE